MKLLHLSIIIIPVTISLIAITIYIIMPITLPIQPMIVTIVGSNNDTIHEGDKFVLYVTMTNPNFFTVDFDSASTTFDKNAYVHHYDNCACCWIDYNLNPFQSTKISIPISCADNIAKSPGETNATVQIQYHINGKIHSVSTSKIFTIFPKT